MLSAGVINIATTAAVTQLAIALLTGTPASAIIITVPHAHKVLLRFGADESFGHSGDLLRQSVPISSSPNVRRRRDGSRA